MLYPFAKLGDVRAMPAVIARLDRAIAEILIFSFLLLFLFLYFVLLRSSLLRLFDSVLYLPSICNLSCLP